VATACKEIRHRPGLTCVRSDRSSVYRLGCNLIPYTHGDQHPDTLKKVTDFPCERLLPCLCNERCNAVTEDHSWGLSLAGFEIRRRETPYPMPTSNSGSSAMRVWSRDVNASSSKDQDWELTCTMNSGTSMGASIPSSPGYPPHSTPHTPHISGDHTPSIHRPTDLSLLPEKRMEPIYGQCQHINLACHRLGNPLRTNLYRTSTSCTSCKKVLKPAELQVYSSVLTR
jgi:hypothetical protein